LTSKKDQVFILYSNPSLKSIFGFMFMSVAFLKTRPSVKRNNAELQMQLVSLCFSAACTLQCPSGYFFLLSPPAKNLSNVCLLKSPQSLPGVSCLCLFGVGFFSGHCNSLELDSARFWTFDIQDLATLCTFLFVFSVLYT